jgi:periplasmic protein TonB
MKENQSNFRKKTFFKSSTQPSLFHYIKEKPDPGVFENMDWSFLTHPLQSIREGWHSPRTQPSLFHHLNEGQKTHLTVKEFFSDIFTGFRSPLFIPSVFCDPAGLVLERAQGRTRKWEASMVSVVIHLLVLMLLAYLAVVRHPKVQTIDNISVPTESRILYMPQATNGEDGGGPNGGSGNHQMIPPSWGRIPDPRRAQLIPPDPDSPRPLVPPDELTEQIQSVEMPMDIIQDPSLPIGDINAPATAKIRSFGPGSGGNPGSGNGPGTGPGEGPGAGPGPGGPGFGPVPGGRGTGSKLYSPGPDVKEPIPLIQPLPPYTEEARKARIEGVVVLQAVILKDGTVTDFRVVKGLGHGLDESAINTISSRWRFRPGTHKGSAVDVLANIEVRFRMF